MKKMKSIRAAMALAVLAPFAVNAQTQSLHIGAGAKMVMLGAPQVVLNNIALINDGTITPAQSTFRLEDALGLITTGIGGASTTTFFNLTVNRFARPLILDQTITVTGDLTMQHGDLLLNTKSISLGSTGRIVGERNDSRISGDDYAGPNGAAQGGMIWISAIIPANKPYNPGNLGIEVTGRSTSGGTALGLFIIQRFHNAMALPSSDPVIPMSVKRQYKFTFSQATGDVNARLFYLDPEIPAGTTESGLVVYKSPATSGTPLSAIGADSINTTENWVAKNHIAPLTFYTLGQPSTSGAVKNNSRHATQSAQSLSMEEAANAAAMGSIKVYPSPAHDQCIVELDSKSEKRSVLLLYDQTGNLLQRREVYVFVGKNQIRWDLSGFAAGIYYLSVDGARSIKLVHE